MKKWTYMLLALHMLVSTEAAACTIFTVKKGNAVFFAGNEDQATNHSYLVIDKTGKYGVVFIATPTDELPMVMQMGVNEKGLSYDINSIGTEHLVHVPGTVKQTEWALVKLMREAASVDEMLRNIFKYDWGTSISYQIHIADRSGDAAVIHPGNDGKLTFTRIDRTKGYLISTNFNIRDMKLQKMLSSRYQVTERKLQDAVVSRNGSLSQDYVASVLDATHQKANVFSPVRTIYSTVVDVNAMSIYVYYEGNFSKPYVLDVRSELSKTRGRTIVPLTEIIASLGTH